MRVINKLEQEQVSGGFLYLIAAAVMLTLGGCATMNGEHGSNIQPDEPDSPPPGGGDGCG